MVTEPQYLLNRRPSTPDGTLGAIFDDTNSVICFTCELPWLNDECDVSCIPAGTYNVIRHNSPAHPNTWEITNVPGRTGILIHNGNTENDSLGCIVVGDSTGTIGGLPAVLNSDAMLAKLQNILPDNFVLTIE